MLNVDIKSAMVGRRKEREREIIWRYIGGEGV